MKIAVNFDGTIVEHAFPKIGKLKPGAVEALQAFHEAGHRVIVTSCRNNMNLNTGSIAHLLAMKGFLECNGLNFCRIDYGNQGKVLADVYIDDRGITYSDNWDEIREALL